MLFLKYSLILSVFLSASSYAEKFSSKVCLDAKFQMEVINEGKFFGLLKNNLRIEKDGCISSISFKNILETTWLVDICREPIHIKVTSKGNQSVVKRIKKCSSSDQTDFCLQRRELLETLQDYGLIFAQGEREKLNTQHGQVYCTYLLVKRYLDGGVLFSKYDEPINIFTGKVKEVVPDTTQESGTKTSPRTGQIIKSSDFMAQEKGNIDKEESYQDKAKDLIDSKLPPDEEEMSEKRF